MWKSLVHDGINYLIKIKGPSPVTILLTDLINIWSEELDEDCTRLRFKKLNPLYVGSDVVNELTLLVQSIADAQVTLSKTESNIKLEIKSGADEYPVRFHWDLIKRTSDVIFEEFTLSLIQTIQVLEVQQRNLCSLLERKDKEIREYKREKGGEIAREYLKTEKFDHSAVNNPDGDTFILNVFTSDSFLVPFNERHGDATSHVKSGTSESQEPKRRKLKPYVPKGRNS